MKLQLVYGLISLTTLVSALPSHASETPYQCSDIVHARIQNNVQRFDYSNSRENQWDNSNSRRTEQINNRSGGGGGGFSFLGIGVNGRGQSNRENTNRSHQTNRNSGSNNYATEFEVFSDTSESWGESVGQNCDSFNQALSNERVAEIQAEVHFQQIESNENMHRDQMNLYRQQSLFNSFSQTSAGPSSFPQQQALPQVGGAFFPGSLYQGQQ